MDAFDVLALAPTFDLDTSELEQRYRDLQKQLHPDKFVQASASEKRASLARAVDVNQAYRLLRDDLKRAELLLARVSGKGDLAGSTREPIGSGADAADPGLLMEVMELREALAEAKAMRDHAAIAALSKDVADREGIAIATLRAVFNALGKPAVRERNGPHSEPAELPEAHRALARLRYYRRFREEVTRFEEETAE